LWEARRYWGTTANGVAILPPGTELRRRLALRFTIVKSRAVFKITEK
jgi:hypothetical protein